MGQSLVRRPSPHGHDTEVPDYFTLIVIIFRPSTAGALEGFEGISFALLYTLRSGHVGSQHTQREGAKRIGFVGLLRIARNSTSEPRASPAIFMASARCSRAWRRADVGRRRGERGPRQPLVDFRQAPSVVIHEHAASDPNGPINVLKQQCSLTGSSNIVELIIEQLEPFCTVLTAYPSHDRSHRPAKYSPCRSSSRCPSASVSRAPPNWRSVSSSQYDVRVLSGVATTMDLSTKLASMSSVAYSSSPP